MWLKYHGKGCPVAWPGDLLIRRGDVEPSVSLGLVGMPPHLEEVAEMPGVCSDSTGLWEVVVKLLGKRGPAVPALVRCFLTSSSCTPQSVALTAVRG